MAKPAECGLADCNESFVSAASRHWLAGADCSIWTWLGRMIHRSASIGTALVVCRQARTCRSRRCCRRCRQGRRTGTECRFFSFESSHHQSWFNLIIITMIITIVVIILILIINQPRRDPVSLFFSPPFAIFWVAWRQWHRGSYLEHSTLPSGNADLCPCISLLKKDTDGRMGICCPAFPIQSIVTVSCTISCHCIMSLSTHAQLPGQDGQGRTAWGTRCARSVG